MIQTYFMEINENIQSRNGIFVEHDTFFYTQQEQ